MNTQLKSLGLSFDNDFLYDIKVDTGKNNRIIYPCRNSGGFFQ